MAHVDMHESRHTYTQEDLSEWDAGCMGHLSVTPEFLDGIINLEQLLTGHLDTLHASDMSSNQAAGERMETHLDAETFGWTHIWK